MFNIFIQDFSVQKKETPANEHLSSLEKHKSNLIADLQIIEKND